MNRWYIVVPHCTKIGRVLRYWGYPPLPTCTFGHLPLLLHEVPIHLLSDIDMNKVVCYD